MFVASPASIHAICSRGFFSDALFASNDPARPLHCTVLNRGGEAWHPSCKYLTLITNG
jgi:hypothetical protein